MTLKFVASETFRKFELLVKQVQAPQTLTSAFVWTHTLTEGRCSGQMVDALHFYLFMDFHCCALRFYHESRWEERQIEKPSARQLESGDKMKGKQSLDGTHGGANLICGGRSWPRKSGRAARSTDIVSAKKHK
jgi:hypothetical protein